MSSVLSQNMNTEGKELCNTHLTRGLGSMTKYRFQYTIFLCIFFSALEVKQIQAHLIFLDNA